jgi:hypothetical protein
MSAADRPGEADADVAEILHTLDAFHCVPDHGTRAALVRLTARLSDYEQALRYMAEYEMTGTEMTLHIDFQSVARDVLDKYKIKSDQA